MASNFIPMLSSSPPPLDDCPDNDDDDDEEFGTFTSANIAFDSSFDSPVAEEKYKSFIKTGENGINDLNAFSPPTQNFTLSFTQQNQIKHKKNITTNEIDKEDKFVSNSDKISGEGHSSTKKLNVKNRDCYETSQNRVPDVMSNNRCDSYKENDRSKRKQSSTQSNEGIEMHSVHSNASSCDVEVEDSFVPRNDEIEIAETSGDVYIPCRVVGEGFQSTGFGVSNCDEPSNSSEECIVEQSDYHKSKDSDVLQESIKKAGSNAETSKVEFATDFGGGDSFEEDFDDFRGVNSLDDVSVKGGLFFNGSVNEDESFEANFDDFQPFESDKASEFAEFKKNESPSDSVTEKEGHSDISGEFADFKANEEECHSNVEEFDDFQSFDKAGSNIPFSKSEVEVSNESPVKISVNDGLSNSFGPAADQEDDFDEFDDFQACTEVAAPVEQGFATFKAEPFKEKEESESPEFADFEQASFSSTSGETYPNSPCLSSSSHNQEKNVDKLSTVMNAIFPPQEEPNDLEVSYDPESEIVDQSIKSRRLWEKLHEAEQTPGLRFQWGVSHSFQQLLRSVNVDYHSILRTSSVPIFASGLSLLEPVKGQTSSANPELEDKAIPSPRDPIPPVEFDWNSSGLVNPLDTGQSASVLMDLSFLSSSSTASSSTTVGDHSFENELLKPSPASAFPENNSKTFILEELLSKNICSIPNSNITHRPTNLSKEANTVLDQLPDLSYMRAKVLMFPISSKT